VEAPRTCSVNIYAAPFIYPVSFAFYANIKKPSVIKRITRNQVSLLRRSSNKNYQSKF